MNSYYNLSSMYSSYSQYDQNSCQFPTYQDSYPYHHQTYEHQFSYRSNESCDTQNSSHLSMHDHTSQPSFNTINQDGRLFEQLALKRKSRQAKLMKNTYELFEKSQDQVENKDSFMSHDNEVISKRDENNLQSSLDGGKENNIQYNFDCYSFLAPSIRSKVEQVHFSFDDEEDSIWVPATDLSSHPSIDLSLEDEHIPHMLENNDHSITILDTYEEGETYEEKDNLIINHSDQEEKSKRNDQDLSHQTPLDPIIKHESIFQNDDGVICKKDGDPLSFSYENIDENSEVSDLDSVLDPYLFDYFEDDSISHLLDDEYDFGDDIISINEENIFDEKTKDISIKDVTPKSTLNENMNIGIKDKFDSHDLNAKDYDLDKSIEKDVEEPSTMLLTTHCTSESVTYDESPLLDELNHEHDDPYMISISNEHNDPPIFSNAHKVIDCEIKENESMMSDSHALEDMKIIPNLGSTERCVEEIPRSLPIIPHTPYYQVHDENIILEDMSYEYHDPFLIERDTDHLFHIPPLSCMHHVFIKIPKIFSFSFIIFKIKNYKKITLHEKLLPENLDYIHWEDDFPIFILVYDLD